MTAASMWTRIKANIAGVAPVQGSGSAAANTYRDAVGQAMCQGIIDEIKANAVVGVISVSGVTPGGGVSGSGAGTITG
jgi:hypothetical protein